MDSYAEPSSWTRNWDDADEEEECRRRLPESPEVQWVPADGSPDKRQDATVLLIATSAAGAAFCQSWLSALPKEPFGTLELRMSSEAAPSRTRATGATCAGPIRLGAFAQVSVVSLATCRATVAQCPGVLPAEYADAAARMLLARLPCLTHVFVFHALPTALITTATDATRAATLWFACYKALPASLPPAHPDTSSSVRALPPLPPYAVLQGLPAALLAQCVVRRIAAAVLVSALESGPLTASAPSAYAAALPHLAASCPPLNSLPAPSPAALRAAMAPLSLWSAPALASLYA